MKRTRLWIATACLTLTAARGDHVLFKSGDRLTGTVVKVEKGQMTFTSQVAGKLTLKLEDIETFATDAPIEIALRDGSVLLQKATEGAAGAIAVPADGAAQPKAVPLSAIDKINPEKPHWKGAVVAGATAVRGNTKSDSANITADAVRRSENDRTTLGAGYIFASQHDNNTHSKSTSADEWFVKGKYDYFFTQNYYAYGNGMYEKDRISSLERRVSPGLGLGYQWAEGKDLSILTEGGGSYIYEQYSDPAETRTYMAARFAYQVEKAFNAQVSAFHNLEYLPSLERSDSFLVNTDIGLRAKMTERLLIEVKTRLAYNSKPAEDHEKKDFRHMLGFGWTF